MDDDGEGTDNDEDDEDDGEYADEEDELTDAEVSGAATAWKYCSVQVGLDKLVLSAKRACIIHGDTNMEYRGAPRVRENDAYYLARADA